MRAGGQGGVTYAMLPVCTQRKGQAWHKRAPRAVGAAAAPYSAGFWPDPAAAEMAASKAFHSRGPGRRGARRRRRRLSQNVITTRASGKGISCAGTRRGPTGSLRRRSAPPGAAARPPALRPSIPV
jgi:hypothetical protein